MPTLQLIPIDLKQYTKRTQGTKAESASRLIAIVECAALSDKCEGGRERATLRKGTIVELGDADLAYTRSFTLMLCSFEQISR